MILMGLYSFLNCKVIKKTNKLYLEKNSNKGSVAVQQPEERSKESTLLVTR